MPTTLNSLTIHFKQVGKDKGAVRLECDRSLTEQQGSQLEKQLRSHHLITGVQILSRRDAAGTILLVHGKWDWVLWRSERLVNYCSRTLISLLNLERVEAHVHHPLPNERRLGITTKTIYPRWQKTSTHDVVEDYRLHHVM